jgi:hypothetical protein
VAEAERRLRRQARAVIIAPLYMENPHWSLYCSSSPRWLRRQLHGKSFADVLRQVNVDTITRTSHYDSFTMSGTGYDGDVLRQLGGDPGCGDAAGVAKAYKRALVAHHPDRAARAGRSTSPL